MENKDSNNITQTRSRFRKVSMLDLVTIKIAREAILLDIGDRMLTVDDYVDLFDVSRGTVQKALSRLEESGAVTIEKRGVLGSYLVDIDRDRLWYEADWAYLTGAGALPRTRLQEALAASVYTAFEEANVPFALIYLQGALRRVKGLIGNQYDFMLASKSAVDLILPDCKNQIKVVLELEPYSYLSGYTVITRIGERPEDAERIGIDMNSPDHAIVTKRLFDERVERGEASFVEIKYARMPTATETGIIDAFIFNRDILDYVFNAPPLDLHDVPLDLDLKDLTRAVVLTSVNNYRVDDLLRTILKLDRLAIAQQEVFEGKRLPVL